MGIGWVGYLARLVRASMIEVLSANYIRNARAFGLKERQIIYRYALRIAVAPTVTVLGIGVGVMLGSAVFAEIVFARPGIGKLMYDAVILRKLSCHPGRGAGLDLDSDCLNDPVGHSERDHRSALQGGGGE